MNELEQIIPGVTGKGVEHGTHSTYLNYGCRCAPCKASNASAHLAWKKRKRLEFGHGTEKGRKAGCECKECKPPKVKTATKQPRKKK